MSDMICKKCGEKNYNINDKAGYFRCKGCGEIEHIIPINTVSKPITANNNLKAIEEIKSDNTMYKVIALIGWVVIVIGVVVGIAMASNGGESIFIIMGVSVVSGVMLLGFGEVIKLLDIIRIKIK